VSGRVLTADEIADLAGLDQHQRALIVIQVFAIKEAIYKAIDPFMRRYVGFREVSARSRPDGSVDVAVPARWGLQVEARWRAYDEFWIATARARRR
jgi:enterobactin synthetase component D